jgi:hypothetical protein
MISQSCDFDEFLHTMRDREYLEVIYLADKEATEAERLKYRSRARRLDPPEACVWYADLLKGFIRFMRYGVKNSFKDLICFREYKPCKVGGFWQGIHVDFLGPQMAHEIVNVDMGV